MWRLDARYRHRSSNVEGREARNRSNILFSIPDHLLVSIVNRIGRLGFYRLGPLLATGVTGRDIVYKEEVLKEVGLQWLLQDADLVHKGSMYRPFFMRCVKAGNLDACYLESIRLAVWEGKIEEAMELLSQTSPLSGQMEYALGLFLISRGHYHVGMKRFALFKQKVGSHDEAELVAQRFYRHCREIMPLGLARPPYVDTWRFDDVPDCASNPCTIDNRCPQCFAYWRSIEFVRMF